jgi:hypothetical protein
MESAPPPNLVLQTKELIYSVLFPLLEEVTDHRTTDLLTEEKELNPWNNELLLLIHLTEKFLKMLTPNWEEPLKILVKFATYLTEPSDYFPLEDELSTLIPSLKFICQLTLHDKSEELKNTFMEKFIEFDDKLKGLMVLIFIF